MKVSIDFDYVPSNQHDADKRVDVAWLGRPCQNAITRKKGL